jgi:hypothetical protein
MRCAPPWGRCEEHAGFPLIAAQATEPVGNRTHSVPLPRLALLLVVLLVAAGGCVVVASAELRVAVSYRNAAFDTDPAGMRTTVLPSPA